MLLIKHKKEAVQAIRSAHKPFTVSFLCSPLMQNTLSLKRVRIKEKNSVFLSSVSIIRDGGTLWQKALMT